MSGYKLSIIIFLCVITQVFAACSHYYKATQLPGLNNVQKAVTIDSLKNQNRYIILRNGESAYSIKNASISKDKRSLTCILQKPAVDHRLHLRNGHDGKFKYNNKIPNDRHVLNEVHFYITPDTTTIAGGSYRLALETIKKIEIIEKDKKRTTASFLVGVFAGMVAVLALGTYLFSTIEWW